MTPSFEPDEEVVQDIIDDERFESASLVIERQGAYFATKFGATDLDYEDFVVLAAHHLTTLEDQSEKTPDETLRDVIQARNDMRSGRPVLGGDGDE